jgi:CheY-like chemotaxis protein
VIVLSGSEAAEDLDRTRAAGFTAHLVKPTTGAELVRAIEEGLRQA